jgi:hypothetical protein
VSTRWAETSRESCGKSLHLRDYHQRIAVYHIIVHSLGIKFSRGERVEHTKSTVYVQYLETRIDSAKDVHYNQLSVPDKGWSPLSISKRSRRP